MGFMLASGLSLLIITVSPNNAHDSKFKFGLDLYGSVAGNPSNVDKDIALSPVSADAALSMVYVGAKSTTKSQLATALGIPAGMR